MKYSFVTICLFTAFKFVECTLDPYITGGSFADYSQYPHSVFLVIHCQYISACGGSIVNQNIILTAAHCTEMCEKGNRTEIHIKYGHHNVYEMKTTFMKHYIQHEKYNTISVINDICLMSTTDKIVLNKVVKRVIIMEHPPLAEFGYVAGWGMDEGGTMKTSMKHTRSKIQKTKVCSMVFGKMPPGMFCSGPLTGLGTAKGGDSGSALVLDGYIQIGIVSHNMPEYSLVAYTNVSYYFKWITINSKRLFCMNEK